MDLEPGSLDLHLYLEVSASVPGEGLSCNSGARGSKAKIKDIGGDYERGNIVSMVILGPDQVNLG